jgi:hypothetical protein
METAKFGIAVEELLLRGKVNPRGVYAFRYVSLLLLWYGLELFKVYVATISLHDTQFCRQLIFLPIGPINFSKNPFLS